jgi:hypothetical protein
VQDRQAALLANQRELGTRGQRVDQWPRPDVLMRINKHF